MDLNFVVFVIYIVSGCTLFSIRLFTQEDDDVFVQSALWRFVLRPLILGSFLASVGAFMAWQAGGKGSLQVGNEGTGTLYDYIAAPFILAVFTLVLWAIGTAASYFSSKNVVGDSGESRTVYSQIKPTVTFAHVSGMAELKAALMEVVSNHKKSGKNGILLTGDPGNGKTFIAEALAGELKWGFMPITIGDIKSKWMGQTTEQLQAVFNSAKRNGKLILFFDECDSMLMDRSGLMAGDGGGAAVDALGTTNAFLTNIVDIRRHKNIIVIAASNYLDKLDSAAIRDGRFDFKIHIPNPDADARRGLLEKFSKDKEWQPVIPEDVMSRLVKRWEGFSVVRIRGIAERILKNTKSGGKKEVSLEEAFKALRQIQGSMGDMVGEDTPTLRDGKLHFDPALRDKLITLATRLENIDEVERLGGSVPKGVIFWGPPGTGKTAVAKSLAKTSGWAFLATTGSDLLASNGTGIDDLIKKAKDLRPCIIFIDEAEEALGDRSNSRYGSIVTNKILAVTDGTKAMHDVMFIAATNHPDQLDAAIVRGGRFSEHFEFQKPKEDTVLQMVAEWIHERQNTTPFHNEFTPAAAARFLEGESPSNIKDKLQQAVNNGVGRILSNNGEAKILLSDLQTVL
jgi:transitional endoplasmic reticulum ATPase